MAADAGPGQTVQEDETQEDEYNVEAIRAKRKNSRTQIVEYLIKWQDYPESANTWEPIDNLQCPDLILKFQEEEKAKRKRKKAPESQTKRSKTTRTTTETATSSKREPALLVEDEIDNESSTETLSSTTSLNGKDAPEQTEPKLSGFQRGLPIENIVGSITDDQDKLSFFVKWKGAEVLEVVDADELEEKAPRELCAWYRERLFYTINNPTVT